MLRSDQTQDSPFVAKNRTLAVFLVSIVGLFLEMLLIRWISTEIRIFAYLQNTVLVVCILGLGMGCFTCRKPVRLHQSLLALLTLLAILAVPFSRRIVASISELLSVLSDLMIWHHAVSRSPWTTFGCVGLGLVMTLLLMTLLWEIFVPIGRLLGRFMDDHPRTIWAYSVNVVGSLLGIWLFVALSALDQPPFVWLAAAAVMLSFLVLCVRERGVNFALVGAVVVCAWFAARDPNALEVSWSPYQKLALTENIGEKEWPGKYLIAVNNTGYQGMIDLSPAAVAADVRIPEAMRGQSQYDLPMLLHPDAQNVLIVGAGSGNDAAGALRGGAKHVTAVEIDPAIIRMGKKYHPEHPYSSEKVTVVNDDARSFFASTHEKFDLIVFGLLDSHTTTAMTNARLDHYVYTKESIAQAKSLLTESGVMVLSFDAMKAYVAQRMGRCVTDVFQQEPIVFKIPASYSGWGGVFFITGNRQTYENSLASNVRLANQMDEWKRNTSKEYSERNVEIATDDWPYIYLQQRKIPTLYYLLAALLIMLLCYCNKRLDTQLMGFAWKRPQWHFFFLGAAFMLLEVLSISKAAVVFGNTWLVNAIIISGILLMVLVSNVAAARFRQLPHSIVNLALVLSCILLYAIDLSSFAFLPYVTKSIIVGLFCATPMFFSGLIFISSFHETRQKDLALGANLIGALAGGLLQSLTFITGINSLLLVVAALYTAATITRRSRLEESPHAPEQAELEVPNEEAVEVAQETCVLTP